MKEINYNMLFRNDFNKSQEIDKKVMGLVLNDNSENLLEYLRAQNCNYFYLDDFMVMQTIHKFTRNDILKSELDNHIECISKQEDVHFVKIIKDEIHEIPKMIIEREENTIEVMAFSKLVPESLKYLPNLESINRQGECFDLAIEIIKSGIKCNIVTGYIYGTTDKSKFLHSWLEAELDGKEVVIDGIFNAVFNKEGYYALTKAEKKQVINNKDYIKDVRTYLTYLNGCVDTLPLETYLFFRDEIMSDIKSNESIYNNFIR